MRWRDLGASGGPAEVDRPSVKGKQCCGHSPWPPPIPTPNGQARTGTALHTQSRGAHPASCWHRQGPSLRVGPPRRRAW